MKDNRNYIYSQKSHTIRSEYPLISDLITKRGKILDLGCGDGSLLLFLKKENKLSEGLGIDISTSGVKSTQKKGFKALKGSIDSKLPFKDKAFDYAICNVTIQMVMYPEILVKEMVRISSKQIITIPNFAFILNRLDLLINGIMPRFMIPRYHWYSTGHIHQLSLKDFVKFCEENGIKIINKRYIGPMRFIIPKFVINIFPNMFALTGLYLTNKVNTLKNKI